MAKTKLMDYEKALEKFEAVIGLEVHVELNTETKMFTTGANSFGDEPNSNLTPACIGLPGALPVINERGVEYAIRLGLALGCDIAEHSGFARKNYFYPDMSKNYQISQADDPIASDGSVEIELASGRVVHVPVERAHIEEDAGKLNHVGGSAGRIQGAEYSLVDYNRAGVPLIEIVTEPIIGAGDDAPEIAATYVATIRDIVKSLGVSDARMEQGNIRCDANVSLRPRGTEKLGTRTETKNVNSLRSIERAVRFEIQRQAAILESGGEITQETRHWHEDTGETSPGRPKSDADDYRYFPDPDLPPLSPSREYVEELRKTLPEHPTLRKRRLRDEWGFQPMEFRDVVNAGLTDAIEATVSIGVEPQTARKWWMGEVTRIANERGVNAADIMTPQQIADVSKLIDAGTLNDKLARQVIQGIIDGEGTAKEIVEKRGLAVVSDDGALTAAIDKALAQQPDVLDKIREGKVQAAGAVIGAVMKEMRGQADAARVRELIMERAGQ